MNAGIQFDEAWSRRVEAIYTTADMAAQRHAVLRMLAPQPGERIVDIGCGPGFLVRELASSVGDSGIVRGVDVSEAMLEIARRRCADRPGADCLLGDAVRLPFANGEFDAVACVQVLEYIDDVVAAIGEMFRVLRPGGRAVVMATDWDSVVWHAADRARMTRVIEAYAEHCPHPHLPCTLGRMAKQAGFVVADQTVYPLLNTRLDADAYSRGIMDFIAAFVPGHRGVTSADATAWRLDLEERAAHDDYFFSLNRYLLRLHRPAPG